jgi:hypothetical protein
MRMQEEWPLCSTLSPAPGRLHGGISIDSIAAFHEIPDAILASLLACAPAYHAGTADRLVL